MRNDFPLSTTPLAGQPGDQRRNELLDLTAYRGASTAGFQPFS
jgi:hypothetical protein